MYHRIRTSLIALLAFILPLGACAQGNSGLAPVPPTPVEAQTLAATPRPAPQLVHGLADFTDLMTEVGPGVVNVETIIGSRQRVPDADMENIPEYFRRFFGPDFPQPEQRPGAPRGRGMGSGFIISPDGYVLTNHHVIDGAQTVTVRLSDRREFEASIVGSDEQYDVALLKIEASDLPVVKVGNSDTLRPGQWVVAIGSPFGLDHSITAGIVSALGRNTGGAQQRYVPFIQSDVAINRGNSGGPLLNTQGEVVGINSQIFSSMGGFMGISFAIPINLAMNAVEQFKTTGRVSRGQLGAVVEAIDNLKAQGLGLPDNRGALVNQVMENSAASRGGLQVGDVIRAVNGTTVDTFSDVPPLIGSQAPGSRVKLSIIRDGRERELTVTLTELDEDARRAANTPSRRPPNANNTGANALLGLELAELSASERRQHGLEDSEGVRITAVNSRSAREAGLAPGVIITQVNRTPVGSIQALNRALGSYKAGDVIMLLVRSGSSSQFVAVRAGD